MQRGTNAIIAGVLAVLSSASICWAWGGGILRVDDDAPPGGDGSSWPAAFRYLQDALAAAGQPDSGIGEIRVAQGTYRPDQDEKNPQGTQDQMATFALIDGVALRGGYAGIGAQDPDARDIEQFETILTGQIYSQCFFPTFPNTNHVVTCTSTSGSTLLDGATIQCGQVSSSGGSAIYAIDAELIVLDSTFRDNSSEASDGGCVWAQSSTLSFFNCLFTSNSGYSDANGIYCIGSSLTLVGCDFIENGPGNTVRNADGTNAVIIGCTFDSNDTGAWGGNAGIGTTDSTATIADCLFVKNDDEGSGAISNYESLVDVSDCTFDDNDGDYAGAMYNGSSTVSVRGCTFISNGGAIGAVAGGAMLNYHSNVVIDRCSFFLNAAGGWPGGGIHNLATTAVISNSLFFRNFAGSGGGVGNTDSTTASIVNCTFFGNVDNNSGATSGSAAIDVEAGSSASITNCIVWDHEQNAFGGAGKLSIAYSNVEDTVPPGVGNISLPPLFVELPQPGHDNTWGTPDDNFGNLRLLPGSPCIDAGDNTAVPADEFDLDADGDTAEPIPFDLAGLPRFLDDPKTIDTGNGTPPIVDMGAYEHNCGNNAMDLTGDSVVDAADLAQLLADWGACPGCPADSTGDGVVDAADLAAMLDNWC
jgi:hypothetical protein